MNTNRKTAGKTRRRKNQTRTEDDHKKRQKKYGTQNEATTRTE